MYNLLVTAEKGAWDEGYYQYDSSRFLEYTNEKVAESFQDLTDENIEDLKSFPCIFAYEGENENIRIGYLNSIKRRGKTLLIEYIIDENIPEITFSSIKHLAPLLDIRKWEMNRTHWAIKDENLFERLRKSAFDINSADPLYTFVEALKHLKDNSDQARLLRVIERERELMAKLRDQEAQRTEEILEEKYILEQKLKQVIEDNKTLENKVQILSDKHKSYTSQSTNSTEIVENLRNIVVSASTSMDRQNSQDVIRSVIKKNVRILQQDVNKNEKTRKEVKSFLEVIDEELKRLQRLDNQLDEKDRQTAKAYELQFKNLKFGYREFLENIENLENISDQELEKVINDISNKDKEFWNTVAGNIASPVALAAGVGAIAFAWTGLTAVLLDIPMAVAVNTVFSSICTVGMGSAVAIHVTNKVTDAIKNKSN